MRAPNMQAATDDTRSRYPGVTVYGKGDPDHAARSSDHNEDDTPGIRTPQVDDDSIPEHRAIDVMIGPAFSKAQADAYVARLLADPAALARLVYIIWNGSIWSRKTNWERRDQVGDQHTDHVHLSGDAKQDANAASWPAINGGGDEGMGNYCKKGDVSDNVERLQRALNRLIATGAYGDLKPLTVDRSYGAATCNAVVKVLGGGAAGTPYHPELDIRLEEKIAVLAAKNAGLQGEKGDKGDDGERGIQGEKGDKGDAAVLAPGTVLTVTEEMSAALRRAIDNVTDAEPITAFQSFTS